MAELLLANVWSVRLLRQSIRLAFQDSTQARRHLFSPSPPLCAEMAAPVGAAPADWDLRADGAGSAEVNGFYKQNGEHAGKPQYLKVRG